GDLPLAERKAQMLAIDQTRLRELCGEAELRELLDPESIETLGRSLQRLDGRRPLGHADQIHDLLLSLGDLTIDEILVRSGIGDDEPAKATIRKFVADLVHERRIFEATIAGERRF